ncbi:hypothetical protein GCM10011609_28990 [Lentzea pudingi]|uniref:XRE family transcriptional regulator n=1 Tax=Lentzea pudingi TaxID=1789439 RepID=A0ABQ2HWJ0_9PSEU|nr:XRE family transcriptional regulator [Lentzea pudingi]GGM90268.1 hypothetical protein GCM10011609_28990 [Lentzea pudingi]
MSGEQGLLPAAREDMAGVDRAIDTEFAAALRAAMGRRGLTLDRVRQRLADRGMKVSLSTLSYWQNGRSQPERDSSLKIVDALELLLDLPDGTLRQSLGPRRARGQAGGGQDNLLLALDTRALGPEFADLNRGLRQMITHTTVWLNEHRSIKCTSTRTVLRALRDGVDRMIVLRVHEESAPILPEVVVRFGRLGELTYLPHLRCTAAEILFDRPLPRNETAVVDYDFVAGATPRTDRHYQRNIRTGLRESLIHVVFDPAALPAACHRYHRTAHDSGKLHLERTPLDGAHSVHTLVSRWRVPVHGISWEWPD